MTVAAANEDEAVRGAAAVAAVAATEQLQIANVAEDERLLSAAEQLEVVDRINWQLAHHPLARTRQKRLLRTSRTRTAGRS